VPSSVPNKSPDTGMTDSATGRHYQNERFDIKGLSTLDFSDCRFSNCRFDGLDLTEATFVRCHFYDAETELACSFRHARLTEASFIECDISMVDFSFIDAFGLTLHKCRALGSNFHRAGMSNQISSKLYFCSAAFTENLFSYTNFTGVILEKCELQANRWQGGNFRGCSFAGSDLSRGEFREFDWREVNIRGCNLTDAELNGLDLRIQDMTGVTIAQWQQQSLLESLGLVVI
jgi:fluoroquinolone resistance protein